MLLIKYPLGYICRRHIQELQSGYLLKMTRYPHSINEKAESACYESTQTTLINVSKGSIEQMVDMPITKCQYDKTATHALSLLDKFKAFDRHISYV